MFLIIHLNLFLFLKYDKFILSFNRFLKIDQFIYNMFYIITQVIYNKLYIKKSGGN